MSREFPMGGESSKLAQKYVRALTLALGFSVFIQSGAQNIVYSHLGFFSEDELNSFYPRVGFFGLIIAILSPFYYWLFLFLLTFRFRRINRQLHLFSHTVFALIISSALTISPITINLPSAYYVIIPLSKILTVSFILYALWLWRTLGNSLRSESRTTGKEIDENKY
jgi:hypothetical protein